MKAEGRVIPADRLDDGRWEVKTVISKEYMEDVQSQISDERTRAVLGAARDAVALAVEGIGGLEAVRTMDVWVATLISSE